ncbi:MAG: iron-sulfur cluster carrier protein ApbC [Gammaproteobacteria bacterium]|nr:iron-sulfur cluster carrier protein ApbC [Gammaproteobacteria bacterium]MDH3849075.1 iron-sulfur cluster carrier protein ApbC [Gammaproteobacteria bacterium]MDH3865261.1 iron-sulfur cluster carrier protein ApbC [Gammaproteobacteria bacterium]MDH3907265.1 iron-sulfur cluster carrier protein ApbC [Gammaproteobacteria bacterium]MDH3952840.1 iron-sulfur cluster carrier protein ApbC [Gammaproteobacteria bacterium]
MTASTNSSVKKLIEALKLPGLDHSIGDVGRVTAVEGNDSSMRASVELGFPADGVNARWQDFIEDAVKAETDASEVEVTLTSSITAHGVQRNLKPLAEVRNVIAVSSGKGGVGKSTVAVNLALALASDGASVGLLDADIYGPSQPHMVGLVGERPTTTDGKSMAPMDALGLQVMSIGFLIDPDEPMVWRGPMVTSALNQLLGQTTWRDLDYLIVDMPPGTGDIQLTLSQQVPVSGAVVVTTPQDIAAIDARKGLAMFRKVAIPVLGVIENMSTHICTACGHEEAIFGAGGADAMVRDFKVELLGKLPLDSRIREQADSGNPTVASDPDSSAAEAFRSAARRMAAALAMQGKDYSARFPKIVVE